MNWPDRVFALGGAGKEMAFGLLETEWVRESILEPESTPNRMTVTMIDAAAAERAADAERIEDVRTAVRETKAEIDGGSTGDIEIEYRLLTDDIRLDHPLDLAGQQVAERVAANRDRDPADWWIDRDHLDPAPDFGHGLARKRALGKAIYYKTAAANDTVPTEIDLVDDAEVAILSGLAGGTGSGILFDVARDVKRARPGSERTLFGVLPGRAASLREGANAHAALSELECLSLRRAELFADRVLLPSHPVQRHAKKPANRFNGEAFRRAFPYVLAPYYDRARRTASQGEPGPSRTFPDAPSHAPFVVGVPHILRYATGERNAGARDSADGKQADPGDPYVTAIHPETGLGTDAAGTETWPNEDAERLRTRLDTLAERARDPAYRTLRRPELVTAPVSGGIVSPAAGRICDRVDVSGPLRNAFDTPLAAEGSPPAFSVEAGPPHTIGLTAFIGGVVLDNLRPEAATEGYHDAYRQRTDGDADTLLHHALGLGAGHYIRRRRLKDVERDAQFFLAGDGVVRERLLTDYIETV